MREAVIIGGGDFPKKEYPRELIRRADVIICCDGDALRAFLRNRKGIFGDNTRHPDAIVGDLDSMPDRLADEYRDIIFRDSEQDDNDQTKAFRYLLKHFPGLDAVHFIACTGKREDHTLGNLGQLMEYARGLSSASEPSLDMVSDHSTAIPLTDSATLMVGQGRSVSIFTPDNTLRIKSKGLVWPTDDVVFDNWWQATLNRASQDEITLTFSHPSIALLILD